MDNLLLQKAEHIRTIHFTLLSLLLIIAYLLFSGWEKRGDLGKEIDDLYKRLQLINSLSTHPESLEALYPDWFEERKNDLTEQLAEQIQRNVEWGNKIALHSIEIDPKFPFYFQTETIKSFSDKQLLKYIPQQFDNFSLHIQFIDHIELDKDDASEIQNLYISSGRVNNISIKYFKPKCLGKIKLELIEPALPSAVGSESIGTTNTHLIQDRRLDFLCSVSKNIFYADEKPFFKKYPTIHSKWDDIKNQPLDKIQKELDPHTGLLDGMQDIDLLGIKFSPRHVGTLGPSLIICVITYLYIYINNFWQLITVLKPEEVIDRKSLSLSIATPWFGMMDSVLSRIVSLITIVIAPTIIVWIALNFFGNISIWLNLLATGYTIVIGFLAWRFTLICSRERLYYI